MCKPLTRLSSPGIATHARRVNFVHDAETCKLNNQETAIFKAFCRLLSQNANRNPSHLIEKAAAAHARARQILTQRLSQRGRGAQPSPHRGRRLSGWPARLSGWLARLSGWPARLRAQGPRSREGPGGLAVPRVQILRPTRSGHLLPGPVPGTRRLGGSGRRQLWQLVQKPVPIVTRGVDKLGCLGHTCPAPPFSQGSASPLVLALPRGSGPLCVSVSLPVEGCMVSGGTCEGLGNT